MSNTLNPVIVAVAYNREKGLSRLLDALEEAKYEDNVTLIISIDYGGSRNVVDIANNFEWSHGDKIVRTFVENQGCREHTMKCIDYSMEYGAAIVFEDDILPSRNFYSYVKQTLQYYAGNKNIFAIALHNQLWNGYADALFIPVKNKFDVYIAQIECSWGECFIGEKWREFKKWYEQNKDLKKRDDVPEAIYNWKDSWSKYVLSYIAEKNLYYITPYDSLTTRFPGAGAHTNAGESKYKFQVPLSGGKEFYQLPEFEEAIKYDAFFESISLKQHIEREYGKKAAVDYYGTRNSYGDAQLCLSRKKLPYEILKMYGDDMLQPELNYIYHIRGEDIVLYNLEVSAERKKRDVKNNFIYFGEDLQVAKELADKHLTIMTVFERWLKIIHRGQSITNYLRNQGVENVAIYGMGALGQRLFDELCVSGINIECCIDKNLKKDYKGFPMKSVNEIPDKVDCIIVTAVYYYESIKEGLSSKTLARIISLQEIVDTLATQEQ